MEPESSLPQSQMPANCFYSEQARSSPYPHFPLPENLSFYYSPIYISVSQVVSFTQDFPPNSCICLAFLLHAPHHYILYMFITRTIFGEEYRIISSSFCSFLPSPVTSPILGPCIILSNFNYYELFSYPLIER